MARLPEGTITFMLTDLQGSTRAWESQPKAMRGAMARHDAILARAIRDHAGILVEAGREGDSVLAVFSTAVAAAECALDMQKGLAAESWPDGLDLKVRIALHTGEAQLRDDHYFGPALNRCARLLATGHAGQILLTKATEEMLADEVPTDAELDDLGLHRLKDLARPEQVFQLTDLARPIKFPPILSLPPRLTNMPHYLTNFVGRGAELSALRALIRKSRMVTLTGAGGSGKSRLASELGWACLKLWSGGVWWVELAPVSDPLKMPGAVVAALELPGRGPSLDVATAWLATRRAVLVLDSCEHLVAACAEFCVAALERCPELTIIATSREALGIPGEARWSVGSMAGSDAVRLFEARARLVVPDFKLTAVNLETVTQICAHVDGMPLAIELAAARVDMMTEQEILSQLSDRFHLLTHGSRTAPQRQQTMIATIDWSYRLLTDDEALLFRRLSVFRGGFTLESAQAVCGDGLATGGLDILAALVQKSMVVAERAQDSGSRYRLLDSQLAYGEDRLREAGELELMRRRHYKYFLEGLVARTRNPLLAHPMPGVAEIRWITRESGNLWAAMAWARNNAVDLGLGLAVPLSLIRFGDVTQARSLLADVLKRSPERGAPRVFALRSATRLAVLQNDYIAAIHSAEASVELARELGDPELLALALTMASLAYSGQGQLDAATEMLEEASSHLRDSGDRPLVTTIRNNLAMLAVEKGDYAAARNALVECVATAIAEGDAWGTAAYLDSLAWAQWGLNDHRSAEGTFKKSLAISRGLIDYPFIQTTLEALVHVASGTGDDRRALRLAAAVNRLSSEWSVSSAAWVEKRAAEAERRSRSRLGSRKSEEAWKQGWAMTVEQAIDYALGAGQTENAIEPNQDKT